MLVSLILEIPTSINKLVYFLGLRTLGPFTMFKALPYFYSLYLEVQTFLVQLEPPPILEHPLSFRELLTFTMVYGVLQDLTANCNF